MNSMHWMSDYVLPHPERQSRGKLLSPPALVTYSLFLLALLFSTRLLAYRLPGVLGYATNINLEDLLRAVNQKREENGASQVRLDPVLCEVARLKAEDMFAKNYWAHVSPDGVQPWAFFSKVGYDYLYAGENLAKDFQDSSAVVEAWMNSTSHRSNLLSTKYMDMGLAVVNGTLDGYETTLVVQEFGRRKVEPALATLPQAQAATVESPVAEPAPAPAAPPPSLVTEEEPVGKQQEKTVPVVVAPGEVGNPSVPVAEEWAPTPTSVVSLPKVDVFAASKAIALLLAGFLAGLFLLDGWYVWRQGFVPRLSGHTLAHLGLLVLAMLGIWYVNAGVVL